MSTTLRTNHCISLLLLLWMRCLVPGLVSSSALVVKDLPGFNGSLPFSLEAGYSTVLLTCMKATKQAATYVEVDESNGVHIFYYFVQSENEPAKDPLLLWLQGGPGCSGLSGLVYEIGLNSSDTIATEQLVIFHKKWIDEHPQFASNPLYIGGESYSGIMIPALTLEIDRLIRKESGDSPPFNLKGYIAGNPFTDKQFDMDGRIKFFYGMGLISDELYEVAKENCGGRYDAPANGQCSTSIESIQHCTKDINVDHILEPSCKSVWRQRTARDEMRRLMLGSGDEDLPLPFKCRSASYVLLHIWANDETVRKRLGVRQETIGEWIRCNRALPYEKDIPSTLEHHLRLHRKGYAALIYSGDHDSACSFFGTRAWIRALNLSVTDDWRPWHVDGQVAGFTTSYSSNLTYATVKGAGHTAPEYKPKECLTMFARWISGTPL